MTWPKIPELKQLEYFDLKVAQKLYLPMAKEMVEAMAPATGAYPVLGAAMGKIETEKVKMDGTTVSTMSLFERQ